MNDTLTEGGGAAADETEEDARRFGIDEDEIVALRDLLAEREIGLFSGVWPHNAEAVTAFLAASTQWRTCLFPTESGWRGVYVGLDYAGLRVALDALGIDLSATLFSDIAVLEAAAKAKLNGT